jgi:hypothetical protein
LQSAGTTAITVDTSQNVGIGATSPRAKLEVTDGTTNTAGEAVYQAYVVGADRSGLTEGNITVQSNDAMAINKGGSIAFGGRAVSASASGANWSRIAGLKEDGTSSQYNGYLQFSTRSTASGMTEKMRIASDGKVYIACTSAPSATVAGVRLGNPNDALCAFSSGAVTTETYQLGFYNGNGLVGRISTNGSATSYTTSSDYRLKEIIAPMTGALAKVALLKPVTYKWKADGSDGEGFIAHELQAVVPDCVSGEKDATRQEEYEVTPAVKDEEGNTTSPAVIGTRTVPVYQGIDTSFLVATLTAAIQELSAKNDALTARIVALESK